MTYITISISIYSCIPFSLFTHAECFDVSYHVTLEGSFLRMFQYLRAYYGMSLWRSLLELLSWSFISWVFCQIRKIADCACAGNTGNVFPDTDFKWNRWLAIPACITTRTVMHVGIAGPWWRGNVPDIPGACVTRNSTYPERSPLKMIWRSVISSMWCPIFKCVA